MTMTVERPQHVVALERANYLRIGGAGIKRSVAELPRREGLKRVADLVLDPDELVDHIKIEALVRSINRIGKRNVGRLLVDIAVPSRRYSQVGNLTVRERRAVAHRLYAKAVAP